MAPFAESSRKKPRDPSKPALSLQPNASENEGQGRREENLTLTPLKKPVPSSPNSRSLRTIMASSRFLLSAIAIALMVSGAAAQGKNLGNFE